MHIVMDFFCKLFVKSSRKSHKMFIVLYQLGCCSNWSTCLNEILTFLCNQNWGIIDWEGCVWYCHIQTESSVCTRSQKFWGEGESPSKIYLKGLWFKEGHHDKLQHKNSTFPNQFPQQVRDIPAHIFKGWGIVEKSVGIAQSCCLMGALTERAKR